MIYFEPNDTFPNLSNINQANSLVYIQLIESLSKLPYHQAERIIDRRIPFETLVSHSGMQVDVITAKK